MASVLNSSPTKMRAAASSFKIAISDEVMSDLHRRLSHTRWSTHPDGIHWKAGTSPEYLRELVSYWEKSYANAGALTWIKEGIKNWIRRCKVPTAFALFPKDISSPPREWATRFFDVQRWTEMSRGGHFAAMEEPQLLAQDLRAWFRKFRT